MCEKSLYNRYLEKEKSYYQIEYKVDDLFCTVPTESQRNCREFIEEHYRRGSKAGLLSSNFEGLYKENGKHVHSVSLYLLGNVLMPIFQNYLNVKLESFLPNYIHWTDYQYIWYLPSMFHDFASCIELGTIHPNDSERHRSLQFYLGNHDVRYSPYGMFPYKNSSIPFRFSPELINNYFYYRASLGICEHGIIAGYLFFDRFIKNFQEKVDSMSTRKFDTNGNMTMCGLNWNVDLPMYAAYVADAVICHNIWLGGEKEETQYISFGLEPLLYSKHSENKLSIKKYPLQFMLCLLDTIEPTKRFESDLIAKEVLKDIHVDWNGKTFSKIELSISWCNRISYLSNFDKWIQGIVDMQNWMDIDVNRGENCVTNIINE